MVAVIIIAVCVLAFANGANDNSKGVATLIGAGTVSVNRGLVYAGVMTFLGSATAMLLAGTLVARFSGKGLVDVELLASPVFLTCVAIAAAATVLIATCIAMPISTTHSLVGGLVGVGLSAHGLYGWAVVKAFVVPLLVAPLLALILASLVYMAFRGLRLRLGVTRTTCICIEREYHPVSIAADGSMVLAATGLKVSDEHDATACSQRYEGSVAGVDAQRVLDCSHGLTAGAISFARGLNDTPKMAALVIGAGALASGSAILAVGVAIAVGGLLAARGVARTMSNGITGMNDGQAFTANLVSAALVLFASPAGIPVSTTHVTCGSLFGIGLVNGQAHKRVIGQVVLSWVTTLPLAAGLGWVAWRVIGG